MRTLEAVPQIVMAGDSPRVRRRDKGTSHAAADASAPAIRQTKFRVLLVVRDNGPICGSEVNDLYRFRGSRQAWARVAWDTPRKRAGELADDGYLDIVEERPAVGNNQPESVYQLSGKGLRVLTLGLM